MVSSGLGAAAKVFAWEVGFQRPVGGQVAAGVDGQHAPAPIPWSARYLTISLLAIDPLSLTCHVV